MKLKRTVWMVLGGITMALGAVGAAVPLIPTVPFLLAAAFCFARSSERLHTWFVHTKLYKNNLESYVQHRAMTRSTKIRIMSVVTLTMALGFVMMESVPVGRVVLAAVWVIHLLYFIFGIRTLPVGQKQAPDAQTGAVE